MFGEALLSMKGISKGFPGVQALESVNLSIGKGEVIGLLGENGAGKSTLMKILSGEYISDEGDIFLEGAKVSLNNTKDAQNLGISIIHQELNLLPYLTVAENIYIHSLPRKGINLNRKKLLQDTKSLLKELKFDIDPDAQVGSMTVASQQLVEIAKALSFNSKIIVMDEPTSAITEQESKKLFDIIRGLKEKGISIIYISHRMEEIYEICDRVIVLRDGKNAGEGKTIDLTTDEIVKMLVGREMTSIYPSKKSTEKRDEVVLEVKSLSIKDQVQNASFKLYKGEILGFSGLMGAGRTELMEGIFGYRKKDSGDIFINGKNVTIKSTRDAINLKIGFVPEDRRHQGMIAGFTVAENISIVVLKKLLGTFKNIKSSREKEIAEEYISKLRIKTFDSKTKIANLSGGNQQKAIIAKWLETKPDILILDEPTRGIDIRAKQEIYKIMNEIAEQGTSIIMVSSELPEVLGLSDRVVVMAKGRVTGEYKKEDATAEKVMKLATEGV
ncbi:sugar ABC transporter ATP-binding protein [Halalkalibacter krulwichiae]|uniref:Galactose/methyl galactoside import ATP-binding protein MglA n=1 Tax=Halalkalibacter krulwichiae TaxID=199441 RepID=A0A1X9M9P1_9BACI|nr:sugar ABC transporter ATP-binding protein [Halalkalibacter krulwichiae]ARK30128.1 Galactose/methyl galactoside import ATP-binding protein MglA [Halalkalibacter krulwichiae]